MHCEGKSIDAILDTKEDLEKDIKKCKNEIKDLYDLFQGYNTDMQNIMWPKNKENMMRVDRNDIWWNNILPGSYAILKQNMDDIDNFHETKVIPFENMDDTYGSKAGQLLKTYEGNLEWFKRIFGNCKDAVVDLVKGIAKALWDTVVGAL
ncbi:hypothetical protein DWV06_05900 [Anaerosacchariphilus polymeriproducens]|uniref:Uncharacterized protein n=1 Tax=Anaerosacchariphilus polymeriproducens TaxID=1812858 RepID=A0A371AXE5_9FIRM|nr:hypothetical protein DWV06_05900 [Anaerosacchariphilus polymeriproducens]